MMEKIYTTEEARGFLKISDTTIRRYIRDGKIKTQIRARRI